MIDSRDASGWPVGLNMEKNNLTGGEKRNSKSVAISTLAGAIGATVVLVLVAFVGYLFLDLSLLSSTSCGRGDEYIYCFFDDDWDSGTYLSVITSFYSTVITVLLGLLGAVAAFTFFAIRSSAFQQAEETIANEVDRFFTTDMRAKEVVRDGVQQVAEGEFKQIIRRLEKIETELEEQGLLTVGTLELGDAKEAEETD